MLPSRYLLFKERYYIKSTFILQVLKFNLAHILINFNI